MGSPVLIRYADDFVVHCHTRQDALEIKAKLAEWLAPRGLAFNEDKTRVVTLDGRLRLPGVQRPPLPRQAADQAEQGGRQTDPGEAPHRAALPAREQRSGGDQNGSTRSSGDGPTTTGHRSPARRSTRWIDYLWRLTYKWATYSHPNKPKSWVFARYFGKFNKSRQDRWVFGDRHSGAYMHKFAWTRILRHWIVKARASPDDPALADYWAWRRRKALPCRSTRPPSELTEVPGRSLRDLRRHPVRPSRTSHRPRASGRNGWPPPAQTIITTATREPGTSEEAGPRLIHADCRTHGRGPALRTAYEPSGLA